MLLRTGDYLTLVDCGGEGQRDPGDVAADYIQAQGMARLDLLVVSHYHTDHANGIPQLLRRIPVGTIALPDVERAIRCGRRSSLWPRSGESSCILSAGIPILTWVRGAP